MATDMNGNWINPDYASHGAPSWLNNDRATGFGQLGMGLAGMFGDQKTGFDAANPYLSQIGQQTGQYYQPYIGAGQQAIPGLQQQYGQLQTDPGGRLNQIGSSFQQSPGFKFALQQALLGSGNAAAAGGMAGSPQHEQENMGIATGLANQDYYNWLGKATGLYGQGLQGGQQMAGLGANASNAQAVMIAQQLADQAKYAAEGQKEKTSNWGQAFGNVLGGAAKAFLL